MGLPHDVKQCQNKEVYLDCKTEEYLHTLANTCMCLPFGLKYFNHSKISTCNSTQMKCALEAKNLESKCLNRCEGLVVTSYSHQNKPNVLDKKLDLIESYKKFKAIIDLPSKHKKRCRVFEKTKSLDIKWNTNQLRYVRIYFDSPTFDRFTKDRAAKFVDMLSAIGGTMGLLTGFSIISGVEILYFVGKNIFQLFKTTKKEI